MILLDTNVVSALLQSEPDRRVLAWLDGQPTESIWTTAVTVFEIRFGIELLAAGRRREHLDEVFTQWVEEDIDGRVVPFDHAAAESSAILVVRRRKAGRPIEIRDAQIAGIAVARKASVATRNTRDFEGTGVSLVDPWTD